MRNEEPPQAHRREGVRGRKDKQKNRTNKNPRYVRDNNPLPSISHNTLSRVNENHSLPVAERNAPQPLSRGGTVASSSMQCLTFTHFLSASPTHTPPNSPHNHQPDGLQPPTPTNPLRNTRVGEAFANWPAPPQPSPNQTDPPVHLTRPSSNVSHCSTGSYPQPAPSTRPMGPTTAHPIAPRMMLKPQGIPKKGLKQSMGLHDTEERKHAYNRFRVSSLPICFPLLIPTISGACSGHYEKERGGNVGRLGHSLKT